jgi:hypothetical protein
MDDDMMMKPAQGDQVRRIMGPTLGVREEMVGLETRP